MIKYHKIETPFKRDPATKQIDLKSFRNPDFEYLRDLNWTFTEKVDGMNIRVFWDGHKLSFGGGTDNAQIPGQLLNVLWRYFLGEHNAQLFEQTFGDTEVMLFGEGYGGEIQGGIYGCKEDFILFDVLINDVFLSRHDVREIAAKLGIMSVPIILGCNPLKTAIALVKSKPKSLLGDCEMEGLIGTPITGLRDRMGNRIIVKIKACDFQ